MSRQETVCHAINGRYIGLSGRDESETRPVSAGNRDAAEEAAILVASDAHQRPQHIVARLRVETVDGAACAAQIADCARRAVGAHDHDAAISGPFASFRAVARCRHELDTAGQRVGQRIAVRSARTEGRTRSRRLRSALAAIEFIRDIGHALAAKRLAPAPATMRRWRRPAPGGRTSAGWRRPSARTDRQLAPMVPGSFCSLSLIL
mgnify:CR=1 FL=1